MDSSIYFKPSKRFGQSRPEWLAHTLGDSTVFHTTKGMPALEGIQVAIFGIVDDPGHAKPRGCVDAPRRTSVWSAKPPAGTGRRRR